MFKFILPLCLILSLNSFAQNCNCDSVFIKSKQLVEENYAGWFDKITEKNRPDYINWSEKKFDEIKGVTNDSICAKQLQNWISYFNDKHLRILFTKPKSNTTQSKTSALKILTHNLSVDEANVYFKKTKSPDPIEGIYSHPSYQLAITKIKPNLFYATILSTTNENWKPNEVKLTIIKKGKEYLGTFYDGDKSDFSTHKVKLEDNILDFDIAFFEKQSPNVKNKLDLTEYEISKDKDAPSLHFKENVAIWKFPTFYSNSEEQTAYLLEKYKVQLENTSEWIIDLRGNDGGDYRVGWQLINYIYTKPIIKYNAESRLTKQNNEMWFNSFMKSYYEQSDDKIKKVIDEEVAKMNQNIGKMYNGSNLPFETITINKPFINPKKIALLIDENTVSSGELFTMLARQSDKVVVMGNNSGGMMDYGNILRYKTQCSTIRIQVPMDRMLWIDTGFFVDKEGLKPDVYLQVNNLIEQAIDRLKK